MKKSKGREVRGVLRSFGGGGRRSKVREFRGVSVDGGRRSKRREFQAVSRSFECRGIITEPDGAEQGDSWRAITEAHDAEAGDSFGIYYRTR